MMLAASDAIRASSPIKRPFPRSMQIVKAAFFCCLKIRFIVKRIFYICRHYDGHIVPEGGRGGSRRERADRSWEVEADHAENGQIAVEMFRKSAVGEYSAILMDVRMPVMNGLEATKVIRSLDRADAKEIPIIALTANAFDEDVQRSLQAGMNAHLSKPVESEHLFETLEQLIKV